MTITKGEYLQAMEAAIARKYDAEKQKIARDNVGNQKSIDYFMGYLNTNNEKRLAVLKSNKEKYRTRLQETAEIFTDAARCAARELSRRVRGQRRLGAAVARLHDRSPAWSNSARPTRPSGSSSTGRRSLNDPVSLSLHEAILNNFNFQYIYDYFFDPDKVKGQPYKPLRSPSFTETAVAGKPSEAATKSAADPTVVFFDDFSSAVVGKKPLNWKSTLDNTGATSVVTELKGLDGHWASMSGFDADAHGHEDPLPRDFEVSYDVVAAQNYTWGAHGLIFKLSGTPAAGKGSRSSA